MSLHKGPRSSITVLILQRIAAISQPGMNHVSKELELSCREHKLLFFNKRMILYTKSFRIPLIHLLKDYLVDFL